jgi:hypothetical protein
MAGVITFRGTDYCFIVIEHKGNPHLVYFGGKVPLGGEGSLNLMLAVGKETANDLLFIGGDFNNQPFSAYRRVRVEGK